MDIRMFQAICVKVADEKDPKKIELLKERLRLLLYEEAANSTAIDTDQTKPN